VQALGEITSSVEQIPGKGFQVPIWEDPSTVFGLIMGKPVALVTYDMPKFVFQFQCAQTIPFPPIPIIGLTLQGIVKAEFDFAFGYDTKGIQQLIARTPEERRDPKIVALDLLDGLYISDTINADGTGEDVPEIVLSVGIEAAGSVTAAGVASAGIGGGIKAAIEMNFHDIDPDGPNGSQKADGRIRVSELVENFKHGPLCIFDFRGTLGVTLSAFVSIVGITYRFEIADITLLSFDFSCGVTNDPVLGEVLSDGTLRLNMGPYAAERLELNTEDANETFSASTNHSTNPAMKPTPTAAGA
jgi:hypothetical protein